MTLHFPKPKSPAAEKMKAFSFLEFFAGGGMARAGLGCNWNCIFANDFDSKKADIYRQNWGDDHLHVGDVAKVDFSRFDKIHDVDLAWASFPCQDLSLAGNQAGLGGNRSGSFWGFWNLMAQLRQTSRHPKTIVLENVYGAVTSNQGRDFATLLETLRDGGYKTGALVIDAVHFVPHSRPRLFIVAVRSDISIPSRLLMQTMLPHWTPPGLSSALHELNFLSRKDWVYWKLPLPPARQQNFSDLIDENPDGVCWHTAHETQSLLEMMSPANRRKVHQAQLSGRKMVGTLYKRTRVDSNGTRRQRAEVRFDEVAGCLRTPGGGSSRQTIVVVDGKSVRSRLLAPREAARLMGLSENYLLPKNYNEAYQLAGDGVVVPVVRHLAEYLLEPLLKAQSASRAKIAYKKRVAERMQHRDRPRC